MTRSGCALIALLVSLALLASLMASPSAAFASFPSADAGTGQLLARQITNAALSDMPTAASITHAVRSAIAADSAPAVEAGAASKASALPRTPVAPSRSTQSAAPAASVMSAPAPPPSPAASTRPGRVPPTRLGTRLAELYLRGQRGTRAGALPVTPVHHRSSTTHAQHVPALALSDLIAGDRFALAVLRLTGDTGFLGSIESAGTQILSAPSSPIVAADAGLSAPAPTLAWLTVRTGGDRRLLRGAARHAARRPAASRHPAAAQHPSSPPAVTPGSVRQVASLVGDGSANRAALAAPHVRRPARSRRSGRPAAAQQATAQPAQAEGLPPRTLSAGGAALAGAGGIASGAAAVALATLLVLQILQLLSGRLSLELVPWRSALVTLRLERPG